MKALFECQNFVASCCSCIVFWWIPRPSPACIIYDMSQIAFLYAQVTVICLLAELDGRLSVLVWLAMLVSFSIIATFPRPSGIRTFVGSTILRLIFSVGLEPTLRILGLANVRRVAEKTLDSYRGWRRIERARRSPMWPGFDYSSVPYLWVEFAVGFLPLFQGFFSLHKNQHL